MQGHQATRAEGSTSTSNLSVKSQDSGQESIRGSTELHTATTNTDASTAPIVPTGQQVVLLLVGLIGSGKSTFAQALERNFPQFQRCSQDDLGDRRSVEALARRSLQDGLSVIIDRTNFDERLAVQRATWINIASEFPNTVTWVLVFDTPYEVCAARVAERTGHPTITNPELGLQVLQRFRSQYRPPASHEGYTRILYLKPSDLPDPECSEEMVRDVMRRLQDTPEVLASPPPPPIAGQYRSYGSYRGGFEPRGRYAYRGGSSYRGGYRDGAQGMHQTNLPWSPSRPPRGQDAPSPPWGNGPPASARGPYYQGRDERGSGYDPTQDNWRRS
ncbi:P-loop containing nucleoside triphosphate hydrolase protein [Lentinus brumalis]|uniref:P-loop containing nucleoside triphosphate hydrolase protein n=1 Tax=Lentinus brumalis TaxID=2498619 RepID=A0A371D0X8_9APHY|nr:P-loop containing nucleoside triphosphate hydrolase protein [Polyporus brumalis]